MSFLALPPPEILSAYLFSKTSPRFHAWILNLPIAGDVIQDWRDNRVIKTKAKILCGAMITLSLVLIWRSEKIHQMIQVSVTVILLSVFSYVVSRSSRKST